MPRARSRLIASPSPTPSWGRVSRWSTCTNGSKTPPSFSAAIPMPVSATEIATRPRGAAVRVEVAPAAEPGFVDVAIVDDGEGIPVEHLPLVWERFHRVDPSRSRATGGMGLGLAVVRQLVLGMGGRVRAESEPGRGSRFVVTLREA